MTKPKIKIAQSLLEELDVPYQEHYLRLNTTEKEIIKEALSIWIMTRRPSMRFRLDEKTSSADLT